jgi:hypothetical protein
MNLEKQLKLSFNCDFKDEITTNRLIYYSSKFSFSEQISTRSRSGGGRSEAARTAHLAGSSSNASRLVEIQGN